MQPAAPTPTPRSRAAVAPRPRAAPRLALLAEVVHPAPITRVHLHGGLLTAIAGGSATVWNVADSRAVGVLPAHERGIADSAASPWRLATADTDGQLRVWSRRRETLTALPVAAAPHTGLALCGRLLAAAAGGRSFLWDLARGEELWRAGPPIGRPVPPALDRLGMAAADGPAVRLWAPGGPPVPALVGPGSPLTLLALDPLRVAAAAFDGSLCAWERATGRPVALPSWPRGGAPIDQLSLHHGRLWAAADGAWHTWDLRAGGGPARRAGPEPGAPRAVPVGRWWAHVSPTQQLCLHAGDAQVTAVLPELGPVACLASQGRRLALADPAGRVTVWALAVGGR